MDDDMQWIMAWWAAAFLSVGVGICARDPGVGFISAGLLGFSLIGLSIITNRWNQIKRFLAHEKE